MIDSALALEVAQYALLGFFAQLVDGALGMAYGLITSSVLITLGLSPAAASAAVHTAEIATTGASGLSHLAHRNVDRRLVVPLAISGVAGGVLGAVVLTELPLGIVKPLVAAYLLLMGVLILYKARRRALAFHPTRRVMPLGLAGGFLDAIGGGGWGPIASSTLLARGHMPRKAIGSVNLAEFFVSTAIAAAFFTAIGMEHWRIVAGVVLGGVIAAPLAARVVSRLNPRAIMVAAGILVIVLALRSLASALGLL